MSTNRPAPLPPIAELRAVAEAATPGPWPKRIHYAGEFAAATGPHHYDEGSDALEPDRLASLDASHIATFSPSTVLALLDRVEALERVAQAARDWRYGDDDYAGELLGAVCRAVDELDGDQ